MSRTRCSALALLRSAGTHASVAHLRPRLSSAALNASKTRVNALVRAAQRPGHETSHAMNIRAAEAIVSKAPKAMKIFPISEV